MTDIPLLSSVTDFRNFRALGIKKLFSVVFEKNDYLNLRAGFKVKTPAVHNLSFGLRCYLNYMQPLKWTFYTPKNPGP